MKVSKARSRLDAPLGYLGSISKRARARLASADGTLSVDGLDALIRALSVATVILLSLGGYSDADGSRLPSMADPLVVAAGLVLYNLTVILAAGVPWRSSPGFPLFVLDWAVASLAVALTGGAFSPFIILYYSLAIGAALRVGLVRSLALVGACVSVYLILALTSAVGGSALTLPVMVVQATSLVMVAVTAVAMKRVVALEARRLQNEERTVRQLRLLNSLTQTVLSGDLELRRIMRAVASVSSSAVGADTGLTVLFDDEPPAVQAFEDATLGLHAPILAADQDPDPPQLSSDEWALLREAVNAQCPRMSYPAYTTAGASPRYPGLERNGSLVRAVICVPFLLNRSVPGVLFAGRYASRPFSEAEVNLLTAIGQQMAIAVRLASLYEMEREKAHLSQERERLERDLLSMVSHELRTPLTAIKTSVGALEQGLERDSAGESAQGRLVSNISRSTDRLIGMVGELLDMARLRAGRVTLELQHLNLGDVIAETASQISPLLEARRQSLVIDLPAKNSPRWERLVVLADRRRIEQVLMNIIENAAKYGPDGETITLGATPRNGQVKAFVRDEGPGIAPTERDKVFEKFYQANTREYNATTRSQSMGLGLAIARSIVELHGGQIGVHSRVGHGSTFYFVLDEACGQMIAAQRNNANENNDR